MSNPNAAVARRWFEEVWNQRRAETVDELLRPDSVGHTESGDVVGPDDFKNKVHAELLAALPDIRVTVEDVIADGDNVVVRWSASGTHRGDGMGLKATGRAVTFRGLTWMVVRGGKLVEGWDAWNQEGLLRQLREG
jgi:steroid delta-isomerase-like uncharacterized protein